VWLGHHPGRGGALRPGRHRGGHRADVHRDHAGEPRSGRRNGYTSWGQAVTGDGRNLAALLPASSHVKVSLVLTSPPYGRSTHGIVRNAPGTGGHNRHHLYGDRGAGNLAYLSWDQLLDGWRQIVAGCRQVLRPGGVFVFTCRPVPRTPTI
jgi:modification methylase